MIILFVAKEVVSSKDEENSHLPSPYQETAISAITCFSFLTYVHVCI